MSRTAIKMVSEDDIHPAGVVFGRSDLFFGSATGDIGQYKCSILMPPIRKTHFGQVVHLILMLPSCGRVV